MSVDVVKGKVEAEGRGVAHRIGEGLHLVGEVDLALTHQIGVEIDNAAAAGVDPGAVLQG